MKTSKTGLDLIKTFEGCRLKAYKCPADVWTIGYGHTGSDVKQGMVITQAETMRQAEQGVSQISEVVQSNSAAAQQSSATSEELSAQAATLDELVGQFVLKEE